jgi:hypothetical protein
MYLNINLEKYKKIQDLFPGVLIESSRYKCAICGKEMQTMHSNHFKTHGITKDEYIERFGFPKDVYLKKYLLELVVSKMYSLYVMHTNKWLNLSYITKEYTTKEKEQTGFRCFNSGDMKKHLMGVDTLGVFPFKYSCKFLIIDIDAYYSLYEAREVAYSIKHVLSGYIPTSQIHITYSGNKGYHVEVFFDDLVPISKLAKVFSIVINDICIEDFPGVNVEMRPELTGIKGMGIKLPCGVNQTNQHEKNNYCYFVDENFEPVNNEVKYLLGIEKTSAAVVDDIISEYKNTKIKNYKDKYVSKDSKEKKISIETNECLQKSIKDKGVKENSDSERYQHSGIRNYLNNGLTQKGTRHGITFLLAMDLKEQGYSKEENMDILFKWSIKQVERGLSTSSIGDINKDVKNILNGVYSTAKNYHLSKVKTDIHITNRDLAMFEGLNRVAKETGIPMINYQKTLYAMLVHGKRYAEKDGIFYMTYEQIMDSADVGSKSTICKYISNLHDWGYINIVSRNEKSDNNLKINQSNVYQLINKDHNKERDVFKLCDRKCLCKDCFFNMINKSYGKKGLDAVVTRSIKSKVLKVSSNYCSSNF